MTAMQRYVKVRCSIKLDVTGGGNAKVSCSVEMCEGQCDEDSPKVSFSDMKRKAFVIAMRR